MLMLLQSYPGGQGPDDSSSGEETEQSASGTSTTDGGDADDEVGSIFSQDLAQSDTLLTLSGSRPAAMPLSKPRAMMMRVGSTSK